MIARFFQKNSLSKTHTRAQVLHVTLQNGFHGEKNYSPTKFRTSQAEASARVQKVTMGPFGVSAALVLLVAFLAAASHRLVAFPPLAEHGIVIVTGASSGIGASAAQHVARGHPGWTVLAGVRKEADAAAVSALGVANLRPLILDVASESSRSAAVAEVLAMGKPVLALVNNAGVSRGAPVEFHDVADARAVFETNVFGLLGLTQALLPALRASRGRVVFISSVAGFIAMPMAGVYAASKFAVEALADSLRRELRGAVSVTVVQPAYVKSSIFNTGSAASLALPGVDEAKAAYPHLFTPARVAARDKEIAEASSTDVTDAAIEAALVDARPLTRVQVARAAGMHATVISWLAWALPDRLLDLIDGSG